MSDRFLTLTATVRVSCLQTPINGHRMREVTGRLRPMLHGLRIFPLSENGPRRTQVSCALLDDLTFGDTDLSNPHEATTKLSGTVKVTSYDVNVDNHIIMQRIMDAYLYMITCKRSIRLRSKAGSRDPWWVMDCDMTDVAYTIHPTESDPITLSQFSQESGVPFAYIIAALEAKTLPDPVVADGYTTTRWGRQALYDTGRRLGWLPPLPPEGNTTP